MSAGAAKTKRTGVVLAGWKNVGEDGIREAIYWRRWLFVAVAVVALVLRLNNIGFGLPSLYDPDEPLFMVKAAGLLSEGTFNPHWFGHPASTTIYLTAAIQALVFACGAATGRYGGVNDFIAAAYADPSLIFLPVRIAMALLGAVCAGLTFLLGKRLFGTGVGLLAALLLALNNLHIGWSQVVRSDVQASVFMLWALLLAVRLAETGRTRHAVWAGLVTGVAIATKWPAATVFAGVAGAALYRVPSDEGGWRNRLRLLAVAACSSIAGLFIASPFIFIDFPTVVANLSGEARPFHVGHTSAGSFSNLSTYLTVFAAGSMGWVGLVFALAGGVLAAVRSRRARFILIPATIVFFAGICGQRLIWSRWLIPGLPYLCLFAAVAALCAANLIRRAWPGFRLRPIFAVVAVLLLLPSAWGAVGQARERRNDTRAQAAEWLVQHIRPGSRILLEHLELKLRSRPFQFIFPMGRNGCVDAVKLLRSGVDYDRVEQARGGTPIVDLGSVGGNLETCRADYAVLTYYDLYRDEAQRFPDQMATYRRILSGGRTVALFRPEEGRVGGPVVRIVALPPQADSNQAFRP